MPGKHAPESPRSFFLSVARAVAGALAAVGLVVVLAIVAVGSRSDRAPAASGGGSPAPAKPPPTTISEPTTTGTPSPEPELRQKAKLTIRVLNGTPRGGLAARVFERLDADGYKMVGAPTNAPATSKTTVFYDPKAKADALAFLADHPEFGRARRASDATPSGSLLVVVLGDDYERTD